MRIEARLLEAALGGRLELAAALAWALGEAGEPPAVPLPGSPWRSPGTPQPPPSRAEDFRVHVLNTVREQAELVLAAAEQEASGGSAGSQPPTPQPTRTTQPGGSADEGGTAASTAAEPAAGAVQPPRQRRANSGAGVSQPQWPPRGQQQQQPQQHQKHQKQQPGKLDDDNFPSLAAAAAAGSGGKKPGGVWGGSPARPAPAQQKQGGKRRTIVPAKVASLEVNPLFQLPEPEQRPQQAQQSQQAQLQGAPPSRLQADPASPQQPAARRARPLPAEPLSPPLLPTASPAAPAPLGQRAGQPPQRQQQEQNTQPQQEQQEAPQALQQAQQQAQQPGQPGQPQPFNAADMALPMSPPPVAVRLPAPGAALAASLLLRGGAGGGGGLPGSAGGGTGGGDSASSTPTRRITPIRMQQPAEVQPTFLTAMAATSPRSARRDMLAQPEMLQSLSRPGSRLGTPLAGASAAAFGREGLPLPAATPATASRLGGGPGGSGSRSGGSGSGSSGPAHRSTSGRGALLWAAEAQPSVCQQLSFDSLLSPVKPAAAAEATAQPAPAPPPGPLAATGGAAAGSGEKKAVAAVEVSAIAGPCPAAAPLQQGGLGGPEQQVLGLAAGSDAGQGSAGGSAEGGSEGSTAVGASTARASRQTRALEAAMRRMAPLGGSSSGGFDAPCRHSSSTAGDSSKEVGAPSQSASAACPGAVGAAAAASRVVPLPLQLPEPAQQQGQQQLAGEAPQAAPPEAAAAAQEPAAGGAGAQPRLCAEARRLAELHAALLRRCSGISLAAELDLLLNLLAVPASVRIDPALAPLTRLWCGELAQQYACCVLQSAGSLLRGLGPQLLGDLVALPVVRSAFPRLHAEARAALQHYASTQLHTEKAYRQVRPGAGILSLTGLAALTSDGRRTRSQEEQRRISNRESCRDEWFNLMKEAAAQTHSFAARQLVRLAAGASDRASESGRTAATAAGGDEAGLLQLMQQSAADLLRRLRPDNFAAFAELFTAAVLQAAATGETLLDEELSSLARQNVGRFHSLNQRLQAQGAAGPSRGGAARLQSNQPVTASGFGRSSAAAGSGAQPGRWGGGAGRAAPQRSNGGGGGADEAVAESLRLVAEFPRPQRLYVLFLEAADSHRLNSQLTRCMTGKLREMAAGEHAGAALSERVLALSTLAMFLSYLTFTRAGFAGGAADPAGGLAASAFDSSHPVDAAAALEAAMGAAEGAQLAWTLPWVTRYLWFLKWDPEAARAPYFSRLLARLAQLRGAAELQPERAQFGLAAFCLRSVLDECAERLGPELMPPCPPPSGAGSAGGGVADSGAAGDAGGPTCPALAALPSVDVLLDSRFLHFCCPAVEHARQLFAAGAGAGQRQLPARRVKKIRPTAPSGAVARAALAAAAGGGGGAAGEQGRDLLKLRLQRAFLEQYSTDEHKVKLKDVVGYVSDILAYNCASSAADALLAPAADAIAAQLRDAAAALAPTTPAASSSEGAGAAPAPAAPAGPVQAQQARPPVDPSVRLCLEALAEQLIAQHTAEVLQQGQQAADAQIRAGAVQAMAALTAPDRGPAVVGTAAAVAAEVAAAAAEQRLRAHVPSALRRLALEQLQHVLASLARGSSGGGKGGARQASASAASPERPARLAEPNGPLSPGA